MKNVLLDLGGVVFNSTGVPNEEIDWEVITQLNHKYGHDLNVGAMKVDPFLQEYNQLTDQNLRIEQFLKGIFDTLEFNQKLVDFLSTRGDIFILSDNYRENIEYISERYDFAQWSKAQFYSYDFQMTKYQGTEIFELTLAKAGLQKEEVVFIDDSPEKIANARKAGVRSIRYENNAQVFADFARL